MNPTPTDPREEKPFVRCCDDIITDRETKLAKLDAENAKLRMEIVAVLDQLPSAIRVHEGSAAENICASLAVSVAALRAELEAEREVSTRLGQDNDNLMAELEAARKERDEEIGLLQAAFESVRKNRDQILEAYDSAVARATDKLIAAEAERDTALAAKDAAEKRAAELLALLRHAQFYVDLYGPRDLFDRIERATDPSINDSASEQSADRERTEADDFAGQANAGAVTPAPTQEPPAVCPKCYGFGWIRIGDPGKRCDCKLNPPAGGVTTEKGSQQ